MIDIPARETEVTVDWIRGLLGAELIWSEGVQPTLHIARIGAEYGQMGTLYRAVFAPAPLQGPTSVAIKFSNDAEEATQELGFYRDFSAQFSPHTAHFYAGSVDTEERRGVLVLEDLTAAVQGNAEIGATPDQMSTIAEVIGKIHGAGWDLPNPHSYTWLSGLRGQVRAQADLPQRCARFLARHGETLDPSQRALVTRLEDTLEGAYERLSCRPNTLVHNDLHLENILFGGPDATRPIILDWQTVSLGPGVVDVARALVECLPNETRRAAQHDVVTRYVDSLGRHGVSGYGVEEVEADLGDAWTTLWATIVCSDFVNRPLTETTARQARGIAMGIERVSRALLDHSRG